MKKNVQQVLDWVFGHEAGYAERAEEGGGAVNMGITFTVFKAWWLMQGKPEPTWSDLKAMDRSEASQIYEQQFFKPIHFDELPSGIDYCVYDASVNGGVSGSMKLLQQTLGLKIDGRFGLVTRWAANHRPIHKLIDDFCDVRIAKYKTFSTWKKIANKKTGKTWGQIWSERISVVRKRSHEMVGAV